MTEADFLARYRQTLADIEQIAEDAIQEDDVEIDYESGDDMLTLIFNNGSVAIISRQSAISQLWLAARSGGFHFEYDDNNQHWVCTVNGQTLQEMLRDVCLEQGGLRLDFDI